MHVVVDIETTGLSPQFNKITEIAAVKIENGVVVDEFQTLINPLVHIPSNITQLTSITNEMVASAPTIDEVFPDFLKFIEGSKFVAHNASFDFSFLSHNAKRLGFELTNDVICTRMLANRILPDLYNKKLSTLCEVFKIKNLQAHRALADARATAEVFLKFQQLQPN